MAWQFCELPENDPSTISLPAALWPVIVPLNVIGPLTALKRPELSIGALTGPTGLMCCVPPSQATATCLRVNLVTEPLDRVNEIF